MVALSRHMLFCDVSKILTRWLKAKIFKGLKLMEIKNILNFDIFLIEIYIYKFIV